MVHQGLLDTAIGKHGLLSLTPFTQPIGQVLRVLEGGVDALAFGIIDSVPNCGQEAKEQEQSRHDSYRGPGHVQSVSALTTICQEDGVSNFSFLTSTGRVNKGWPGVYHGCNSYFENIVAL